jgi:hypothetical protein
LDSENLPFYRAHGFFFSYLGEIGVIGLMLCAAGALRFIYRSQLSVDAWALLLILSAAGFSEDFLIPSSIAGHIPIIGAVALQLTLFNAEPSRRDLSRRSGELGVQDLVELDQVHATSGGHRKKYR